MAIGQSRRQGANYVKKRIWDRQCGAANFTICPLSHLPLTATDPKHLHHEKALCLGGEHRENNLVFVHAAANLAQAKVEVAERAKNDARAKKHLGIKGRQTALAGPDRVGLDARKAERSAARGAKPSLPFRSLFGPRP